ncbi:MAG TPA: amino acid transport protein [Polyangia bacterium]|nr:amino acid transport protein [Polyangia bacterium]
MHLDAGWLFASLIVSAVGFILLHYGRKMARIPHVVAGVALLVYPYFVPGALLNAAIAVGVLAILWLSVRLGW